MRKKIEVSTSLFNTEVEDISCLSNSCAFLTNTVHIKVVKINSEEIEKDQKNYSLSFATTDSFLVYSGFYLRGLQLGKYYVSGSGFRPLSIETETYSGEYHKDGVLIYKRGEGDKYLYSGVSMLDENIYATSWTDVRYLRNTLVLLGDSGDIKVFGESGPGLLLENGVDPSKLEICLENECQYMDSLIDYSPDATKADNGEGHGIGKFMVIVIALFVILLFLFVAYYLINRR